MARAVKGLREVHHRTNRNKIGDCLFHCLNQNIPRKTALNNFRGLTEISLFGRGAPLPCATKAIWYNEWHANTCYKSRVLPPYDIKKKVEQIESTSLKQTKKAIIITLSWTWEILATPINRLSYRKELRFRDIQSSPWSHWTETSHLLFWIKVFAFRNGCHVISICTELLCKIVGP